MEEENSTGGSELDDLAVRMESALDRFLGNHDAPQSFVQVRFAADETVGNYPQAALDQSQVYLEDDGSPYRDRFPRSVREPVQLKLRRGAKWTDVLSSDLRSEGFLLSERALGVFEQLPPGNVRKYPAEVSGGRQRRPYTYFFPANHITHADIDFSRSEFYIADMLGDPQGLIEVVSAEDFDLKRKQVNQGEWEGCRRFSSLKFKRMYLNHAPQAAVFGLGTFGGEMYVRRELYEALRQAEVSGLEFKRNNRIFAD